MNGHCTGMLTGVPEIQGGLNWMAVALPIPEGKR